MPACPNCGRTVDEADTFCSSCGASLAEAQGDHGDSQPGQDSPRQEPPGRQQGQGGQPGRGQPSHGQPRQSQSRQRERHRGESQQGQPQRQQPGQQQPQREPGQQRRRAAGDGGGVSRRALLVAGGVGVVAVGGGAFFLLGGDVPDDVRAVIEENARALEEGDLDRYMGTMHPESPIYDQTQSQTESLLQQVQAGELTVDITIESADVSGDRADVEVVQTTRADIPDFRDNRTHQTHELRTYQSEWRIYNSAVQDVEYL